MAFYTDSDHADHYAALQQQKLDRAARRSRRAFRRAKSELIDRVSADELEDLDLLPESVFEPVSVPYGWDRVD